MRRFDDIIIVSDIDGTFLGQGGVIPARNLERLQNFKARGGRFTVATGREHFLVYPSIPDIEAICNYPAIVCNGAYMYDFAAREASRETFLVDGPLIPLIRAVSDACPRAAFRVDAQGKLFLETCCDILGWVKRLFPERIVETRLEDIPRNCWHKVAFDGPPEEIDRVEDMLKALDDRYFCIRSGADVCEIQASCATKGTSLQRIRDTEGPGVTVWAIGDYDNDYDMLMTADRCAVPENGRPRLKAIPGIVRVCDHDEGAIADLIDKIEKGV